MSRTLVALSVLAAGCRAPVTSVGEYDVPLVDAGKGMSTLADARAAPDAATPVPISDGSVAPFYVEAESGALSGGFAVGTDAAASGGAYVYTAAGAPSSDAPGTARAVYRVHLAAGTYLVWGRLHSPDVARNAFWFHMDGGPWTVWRLSTGEDWYWGALHDGVAYTTPIEFRLVAGDHELEFANFIDGVSLDRLYFTTGSERPVGDDTPCRPPDSVRLGGVCVPSCGSQGGTTCGDVVCSGRTPIPAYDCGVCCVAP